MTGHVTHAACFAAWILLATALASGADDGWIPILRQALSEKRCDLSHVLWTRNVPVGNSAALEGRVRCLDGREFDFTRPRPHMKFEVRLCEPAVC